MKLDKTDIMSLFPPQEVQIELSGRDKDLKALINWQPPRLNSDAVGAYHIERKVWWPGKNAVTERLTEKAVEGLSFTDLNVVPDMVNEYQIIAVHKNSEKILSSPSFPGAIYAYAYIRYDDMVSELKQLAEENPDICRLIDVGAASGGNRRIWCMVLGKDTSNVPDKPGVFIHANAHAAENQCSDVATGIIREAIKNYRKGDPEFVDIFENIQARIIPMYNVHGREMTEKGFPGQARKSHPVELKAPAIDPLKVIHCWNADLTPGLDPNRTFDVGWEFPDKVYDTKIQGEKAFSLPETRAVAQMALALRPQISIDYHAPCGLPFYPAKWPDGTQAVDEGLYLEVGENFARLTAPTFPADDYRESQIPYNIPTGWGTGWFYKNFYGAPLCPEGFYEQMPGDSRLLAIGPSISLKELIPGNLAAFVWLTKRVRGAGITVHTVDENGEALSVEVEVPGHMDKHCSAQMTDKKHGSYRRILIPGVYDLRFTAPDYKDVVLEKVIVKQGENKKIDVIMKGGNKDYG